MTTTKGQKKVINKITRGEFYRLVEHMKQNAEHYTGLLPSDVSHRCNTVLGLTTSTGCIKDAAEVAEIELGTKPGSVRTRAAKDLAEAVCELASAIGELKSFVRNKSKVTSGRVERALELAFPIANPDKRGDSKSDGNSDH